MSSTMEDAFAAAQGVAGKDQGTPPSKKSPRFNLSRPTAQVVVDEGFVDEMKRVKKALPGVVEEWVRQLLTILTLGPDERAQQSDEEKEARAELAKYARGDVGDGLTTEQKNELAAIAALAFITKAAAEVPAEYPILKDVTDMAVAFGALLSMKGNDLAKFRGRVVRAGNRTYVSAFSLENSAWVGHLNTKWEEVSRQSFRNHKAEAKNIRQKASGLISDMLARVPGLYALTVPPSSFERNGVQKPVAGGILLVKSDGKNVWPVEAVGSFAKRYQEIIDPANERGYRLSSLAEPQHKPVRRTFSVESLTMVDPRGVKGSPDEVAKAIKSAEMPPVKRGVGFESEKDRSQRKADLRRLWGALQVGIPSTLSYEEHIAMLKKEQADLTRAGDMDANDFVASEAAGRAVLFLRSPWHWNEEHVSRPIFAVTRKKDGRLSFEWPGRLDPLFADVKTGKAYGKDEVPAPMKQMIEKVSRILQESAQSAADTASGDESVAASEGEVLAVAEASA